VKKGHPEEADRGTFWRGTIIDIDTRLRVGRAIGKDEAEVAQELMAQLRRRGHPDAPMGREGTGKPSSKPGGKCLPTRVGVDPLHGNSHNQIGIICRLLSDVPAAAWSV